MSVPTVLVHGGTGGSGSPPASSELECRNALIEALERAYSLLEAGARALEAAQAAVVVLEECPLLNAGLGSTLNRDGGVDMDAALVDGASGRAGAVAAVRHVRNPILAARAVMDDGDHVLLGGPDADRFAEERGLEICPPERFVTAHQEEWLRYWRTTRVTGDEGGTVGAVCLDVHDGLAAATSTGGVTGQRAGRVGDSAVIGAGTYADDRCAVSCTGDGEAFLRAVAASRGGGDQRILKTWMTGSVPFPYCCDM